MDFATTPLAAMAGSAGLQTYVVIMLALVAVMTIMDVIHKKSAKYFFEDSKKAEAKVKAGIAAGDKNCSVGFEDGRYREVSGGEKMGAAVGVVLNEVAVSGEFDSTKPLRRFVHILTMYGTILLSAATIIIAFSGTGETVSLAWNLGALMLFVGSWWFWFVYKVDVMSEGNSWTDIDLRRDMFSLSLMAVSTTALGWSIWGGAVWEILAMLAGISLFGGVYWSKFAHMFFKPFAAYDKRIKKLSGALDNLPHETRFDKSGAVVAQQRDRHSMELLKDAPMNMGLGIKREGPNHY
ncbi:MAG: adenylylsulfate reductase [Gammaproteobacteria bacterium]|jgi:hypothetical protein